MTRDEVLASADAPVEVEAIKLRNGKTAYLRKMQVEDLALVEDLGDGDRANLVAGFLAISLCDAKGERLFTIEDVPRLRGLDAATWLPVFKKAESVLDGGGDEEGKA